MSRGFGCRGWNDSKPCPESVVRAVLKVAPLLSLWAFADEGGLAAVKVWVESVIGGHQLRRGLGLGGWILRFGRCRVLEGDPETIGVEIRRRVVGSEWRFLVVPFDRLSREEGLQALADLGFLAWG